MNTNVTTSEATDLVTIPSDNALQVFTEAGAIDPYLAMIRQKIDAFVPNMETAAGRKEIKSFAYSVTRSKTALDAAGKKVVDELKALPKLVDETRKRVRDTLDQWADEIRKPVEDLEAAEEARIKRHTDAIEAMNDAARLPHGITAADISKRLDLVNAIEIGTNCDEFMEEYERAQTSARSILFPAFVQAQFHEAEQAELAELRKQAAERAEKDRQEAEAKARIEREEAIKREAAAEAEARAKAAESRAQEAERLSKEAADRARRQAEFEAAEAARQEDEERQRREQDTAHRASVNRTAMMHFISACGFSEGTARDVVTAIAKKQIPNVTINY